MAIVILNANGIHFLIAAINNGIIIFAPIDDSSISTFSNSCKYFV